MEQGAPNWVDQLTATSKERPTSSFFELMLVNISSKLLTVPGSGLALYAVGCRGERGPMLEWDTLSHLDYLDRTRQSTTVNASTQLASTAGVAVFIY